ncbi:MAG: type I-E CRISPR-associated protein Cas5/CasD [Eubacteriales bacterium]|nr:type I-E CRISPR-associated protein Cas5/CasD [Eubacteriales bacterium]
MKTVLLKFSGPLQAWGTDSHFEIRHTDSHPSKSGVIGMIAAGLGYRRDETDKLSRLNRLDFAVRIDQPGEILRDYHTAKKYKANGELERTYVTNRYYLQDAVFIVALGSSDEDLIRDVKAAVSSPYFSLFLGRRSLPPTADLFLGIVDTDALSALKNVPWQASPWYKKKHPGILQIFADNTMLNDGSVRIRNDEAISFSQRCGRKFNPRREARTVIEIEYSGETEEHDAFDAIGEI